MDNKRICRGRNSRMSPPRGKACSCARCMIQFKNLHWLIKAQLAKRGARQSQVRIAPGAVPGCVADLRETDHTGDGAGKFKPRPKWTSESPRGSLACGRGNSMYRRYQRGCRRGTVGRHRGSIYGIEATARTTRYRVGYADEPPRPGIIAPLARPIATARDTNFFGIAAGNASTAPSYRPGTVGDFFIDMSENPFPVELLEGI